MQRAAYPAGKDRCCNAMAIRQHGDLEKKKRLLEIDPGRPLAVRVSSSGVNSAEGSWGIDGTAAM